MEEHLRFAACFWHTFCWPGSDVFGGGTFDRPWHRGANDAAAAEHKRSVAFDFFSKLDVPYLSASTTSTSMADATTVAEAPRTSRGRRRSPRTAAGRLRPQAPLGHRQSVQPPALCRRWPPPTRIRRCSPGARCRCSDALEVDAPPRRRQLRAVGRPRGLRDAPQHRHEARARSVSAASSASSSSTSTRSASPARS